jgi:peptidoglycan/xylan/chitin deacetylase (PgdA/CDA1 family)
VTELILRHRLRTGVAVVVLVLTAVLVACTAGDEQASSGTGPVLEGGTTSTTAPPTTPTTVATTTTTMPPTTSTVPPATYVPPVTDGLAPVIYRIPTTDPVIFLTIDDGNTADAAGLQFIVDHKWPVSMFLNKNPARTHTAYFQQLIALGNQVHTHTLNHPNLTKLDAAGQQAEICGMVDVLKGTFGQAGTLLRAPYGSSNATTQWVSAGCGLTAVVHWSGELKDGQLFLQGASLHPGDIILTHFKNDLHANLVTLKQAADAAGLTVARLEDYTG